MLVEAQDSVSDGVAVVVVVEKPAVAVLVADGGLDGFDVHVAPTPSPRQFRAKTAGIKT